jgi:hypothetical protein
VGSDLTWALNVCASFVFVWFHAGQGLAKDKTSSQGNLPIDIKRRRSGENWSGPSKLLLVLASTVVFCFPDSVGTHDQISVHSKIVYVFGNGVSSSTRGGVGLSEQAPHLLHRNLARVYPHSQRPGTGICTLWTSYTLCYLQDIPRTCVTAGFCSKLWLNLFYQLETAVCHLNRHYEELIAYFAFSTYWTVVTTRTARKTPCLRILLLLQMYSLLGERVYRVFA